MQRVESTAKQHCMHITRHKRHFGDESIQVILLVSVWNALSLPPSVYKWIHSCRDRGFSDHSISRLGCLYWHLSISMFLTRFSLWLYLQLCKLAVDFAKCDRRRRSEMEGWQRTDIWWIHRPSARSWLYVAGDGTVDGSPHAFCHYVVEHESSKLRRFGDFANLRDQIFNWHITKIRPTVGVHAVNGATDLITTNSTYRQDNKWRSWCYYITHFH